MESAAYRRLILRLIAVPVVALALLAALVVYGFNETQRIGRRVDRADQAIAQADTILRLVTDQETGIRGYLLTRDTKFLDPYHQAEGKIEGHFTALSALLRRTPAQGVKLAQWQAQARDWKQTSAALIAHPPAAADLDSVMLEQKRRMDALRVSADQFLTAEAAIRNSRSAAATQLDTLSEGSLIAAALLLGCALAWEVSRMLKQTIRVYNGQLRELKLRGQESYAREQWLNTTLRSIGDAVIACDPNGNVVFMNKVAERLTGWMEATAHGRPLFEVFSIFNQHTRTVVENPVDKVRRLGTVVGLANHTILVSRDSTEFYIDDSAAPILDAQQRTIGIVLVFRDITERYAAERALIRTEKLASAGRLAAAIAHEVNNPLEGLVNLIYLARLETNPENVRMHLAQADKELQRVAHITRQSLGFYRESLSAGPFRPDVVAREVVEFYAFRAANSQIKISLNVKTEEKAIGNAGELRQVISNLLANSLDACKAGDAICVRVHPSHGGRDVAGVRVTVADSGCGISAKNLKNVFEPFFTTKKDTGTGLGLWVSRELIVKHGGSLTVRSSDSSHRRGTVFSLFLPAVTAEAQMG